MGEKSKNIKIAESFKATKQRRKSQISCIIECKVKKHMLNNQQLESLKMIFVEAKWIYNYLLSLSENNEIDLFNFNMKDLKEIKHFNKDQEYVPEQLSHIGSSMKDEILKGMCSSIKALATLKEKGYQNPGKLNFISEYSSINLKQYGITHYIASENRIKVQGVKKPLPVIGLKQLKKLENKGFKYEIANAHLILKNDDYYIQLTVMVDKSDYINYKKSKQDIQNQQLGIDFGCQTAFTLSTGEKINSLVEETDHLKRLQRKLNRQKKGSNNYRKTCLKIRKAHERISNIKDDAAHQFVCKLLNENVQIIIQDEQIKSWYKRYGKKIQHSILGRVKAILKEKKKIYPDRIIILNRFVPTTKLCFDCGHIHSDIKLWDREFICPECGCIYDRDIHAAQNMIWIFNHIIGVDCTEFKREDFEEQLRLIFKG
ncbi:MAG: transposase [Wendovervirus sonii]|uniref:Transposase n=1 Tax=phage Lak_Megaphage_Sonny TaxID=3109229 RepID=A0ABZ0Z2K1_9CAUD|nr:MAG: transposase [phage Lak_Megaphage_Sonny]